MRKHQEVACLAGVLIVEFTHLLLLICQAYAPGLLRAEVEPVRVSMQHGPLSPAFSPLQVVPSLGQVKVLHRRLAAAAPQGGEGPAPFPQLAARWAAAHKGKVFTDQVG